MRRIVDGTLLVSALLVLAACSNDEAAPANLTPLHNEQIGFGVIEDGHDGHTHYADSFDPDAALQALDEAHEDIVSRGPSAKVTKNLAVAGRGERLVPDATTDV